MSSFLEQLGVRLPIIQAPMAGGTDTPALAGAVGEAGALGSLGCAYLSPAQIEAAVAALRAISARPFALNLFVRQSVADDAAAAARVAPRLEGFRRELGLASESAGGATAPSYPAQLEAVVRARPRVFSFTVGVPAPAELAALRAAGIVTVGTA